MSSALSEDIQRYITIAHEIVVDSLVDAERAAIEPLVDFWSTWVYWELQLYSGIQIGIGTAWDKIQTNPQILQPAVLNLYTAFRFRSGLDDKHWQALVLLLADSASLKVRLTHGTIVDAESIVNKDTYDRSLEPAKIQQLLLNNSWMVPILLFKMGPRPVTVGKTPRAGR